MELSLTRKRWLFNDAHEGETVNASHLIARLLRQRQLAPWSEEASLCSPDVFPDCNKAVKRIRKAVDTKERIAVFGDYDCDGITSAAQLLHYFRRHGAEPYMRLPHREHDGYGLNMNIVQECIDQKITLLITVDTGIASVEEVAALQAANIDVVITDHHQVGAELPAAHAILHPELAKEYPLPHPSGAGVVYQLLRALEGNEWTGKDIDTSLAMIGTIADVMKLRGDNRLLVQQGLRTITSLRDHPLETLLRIANIDPSRITSTDVAFRIAPRINAAGRLDDPGIALRALLDGGDELMTLDSLNKTRQLQTEVLLENVLKELQLDSEMTLEPPPLLASAGDAYAPGIVGLIAGKLTERFGRPSMIAHIDGATCTASLRSPPGYHIAEALMRHSDLLERYGGHAQAAGCTLQTQNWPALCARLSEDIAMNVPTEELQPCIELDACIAVSDITLKLCKQLAYLEPYGEGNREPVFMLHNVQLEFVRCVGKKNEHLQARIGGKKAIGFQMGRLQQYCSEPVDIACRLNIDSWQGREQPQIMIVDMRVPVQQSQHQAISKKL